METAKWANACVVAELVMRAARAHMHSARERRGEEGPAPSGRRGLQSRDDKAVYLEEVRSDRGKMRKPVHASSLSWQYVPPLTTQNMACIL